MSTTLTAREFNQDTALAKRQAAVGPVFITDRSKPAFVLLSIAHFDGLVGAGQSMSQAFGHADAASIELPLEPRRIESARDLTLG